MRIDMSKLGKLILLPNFLSQGKHDKDKDKGGEEKEEKEFLKSQKSFFPRCMEEKLHSLEGLFCESEKSARKFLLQFLEREKALSIPLILLSEHTKKEEFFSLLQPVVLGKTFGLISDAGLPCLADPGNEMVFLAREKGVEVEAILGPSAIILSLLLSGFSGQKFFFYGYLSREPEDTKKEIQKLEKMASFEKATQIWIEAPYRSDKMLQVLLESLQEKMILCVASDIYLPSQKILSYPVEIWKRKFSKIEIGKKPTVFLLSAR
jgi:16S rRNA (cytidine1402-2'-O)-methyltransferase